MSNGAPQPGTIMLGKYRIEQVLGEGGMGVVARAHHLQLDEPVAIKFLLPQVLGNAEVVQRFLREAQAAVKLKSEHVARVIDVGTLDNGAPYMVMEYLEGGDLSAMLRHYGPIQPAIAADVIVQACDGLAEAHALGIVHRDIKPSNFFITRRRDGSILLKVLDFGISKAPVTLDAGLTRTQSVMGTPSYMSPEQMRSTRTVDARSDIWAIGVVLYEILGGRRPFESEAFSELCLKVAMDPTPPVPVALPGALGEVVARCLEKDPDRRFQSVAELAAALAPYASDPANATMIAERAARILGVRAGPPRAPSFAATTVAMATPTPMHTAAAGHVHAGAGRVRAVADERDRRGGAGHGRVADGGARPLPWVIGGVLVAGAVAVALVLTLGGGGSSSAEPRSAVPGGEAPSVDARAAAATAPIDAGAAAVVIDAGTATVVVDAAVAQVAVDAAPPEPAVKPGKKPVKKPRSRDKDKPGGDSDIYDSRE